MGAASWVSGVGARGRPAPPSGPAGSGGRGSGPGGGSPDPGRLTWLAPVARWLRQPRLSRHHAAPASAARSCTGPAAAAADGTPGSALLNMAAVAVPRPPGALLRRARSRGRPRPRAGALRAAATPRHAPARPGLPPGPRHAPPTPHDCACARRASREDVT